LRQLVDHILFKIAKRLLAFTLKELADRATYAALNNKVGVKKADIQPPRQLPANG